MSHHHFPFAAAAAVTLSSAWQKQLISWWKIRHFLFYFCKYKQLTRWWKIRHFYFWKKCDQTRVCRRGFLVYTA
jgi:hypothetical protein